VVAALLGIFKLSQPEINNGRSFLRFKAFL